MGFKVFMGFKFNIRMNTARCCPHQINIQQFANSYV